MAQKWSCVLCTLCFSSLRLTISCSLRAVLFIMPECKMLECAVCVCVYVWVVGWVAGWFMWLSWSWLHIVTFALAFFVV